MERREVSKTARSYNARDAYHRRGGAHHPRARVCPVLVHLPWCSCVSLDLDLRDDGESEIAQSAVAAMIEQHVLELHVAVDDAHAVDVLEAEEHLRSVEAS
jgi:hypothetical protein